MENVEIQLTASDARALEQLAKEANTSMPRIVRDLLRERMRQQRRSNMRRAAEKMADIYRTDSELTSFSTLDSEDVPPAQA